MKVSLVPPDNLVVVDGRAVHGIDLSDLMGDDDGGRWRVRAVQWRGTEGTVERFVGPSFRITDLSPYQPYVDAALAAIDAEDNPPEPTLAEYKAAALVAIDAQAETARLQFITPGAGQAMTYQEKVAQARAFGADPSPNAGKYPLIYGEVGITGNSPAMVAGVILARYTAWQGIGAEIETTRLTAKRGVEAASLNSVITDIIQGLTWPVAG